MPQTRLTPSKGLLDFYYNQVLKEDSLWQKYAANISVKKYSGSFDQLDSSERRNIRKAYENFKKFLPALRKIEKQGLVTAEVAGQILEIPEVRKPSPGYPRGRMYSGLPITISDAMSRGTEGGRRSGSGKEFIESVLKPKFKLQQIEVGWGGPSWFMKNPKDVEGGVKILQDFYLRRGSKYGISPQVLERVKQLDKNPKIIELLKKGNYGDGVALDAMQKKWGWTPSQSSTTVFRLAQLYNGHKFLNVDFSLPKENKLAATIFEAIDKAPFGNVFHARSYQIAMDTITENLGQKYFEKGTMSSFKRTIRKILERQKIPVYDPKKGGLKIGFNLNEIIGVTPAVRAGAHPYSQFVNLMEGKFNQGHYSTYVKKLGGYQLNLQNEITKGARGDPGSIIKQYDTFAKDFKEIHGLKTGDLPTLSLKDPSKLYTPQRLETLSAQGINLPEHFKKTKYSIGVGEAPTIKEIKETPELIKKINRIDPLKKIVEARVGCAEGCLAAVAKNEPGKITRVLETLPEKARGFLSLLGRAGTKAAPLAALAVAGAAIEPLVKQFRNDDPSTYMTDENQQKGVLLSLLEGETPTVDEEILKWQYPGVAASAAAAIPGSKAVYKARRLPFTKTVEGVAKTRAAMGIPRAALGPVGKVLAGTFSPLGVAATLPLRIAAQRKGGTEWGDIATDPMNWMGPAFASAGSEMATKGVRNPLLLKALRLGMSPAALRIGSRFFGLPGLALSAGLWGYDKWKNRE